MEKVEYDKMLAFISIDKAQTYFNMEDMFSGIIFNLQEIGRAHV